LAFDVAKMYYRIVESTAFEITNLVYQKTNQGWKNEPKPNSLQVEIAMKSWFLMGKLQFEAF